MGIVPGTPRGNRGLASLKSEVGGDDPLFEASDAAEDGEQFKYTQMVSKKAKKPIKERMKMAVRARYLLFFKLLKSSEWASTNVA